VPDSADLRQLIMDELHKRPYVRHIGYQKMVTIIRQLYHWSKMMQYIDCYILKCLEFQ
jgi:hypothetical protein